MIPLICHGTTRECLNYFTDNISKLENIIKMTTNLIFDFTATSLPCLILISFYHLQQYLCPAEFIGAHKFGDDKKVSGDIQC